MLTVVQVFPRARWGGNILPSYFLAFEVKHGMSDSTQGSLRKLKFNRVFLYNFTILIHLNEIIINKKAKVRYVVLNNAIVSNIYSQNESLFKWTNMEAKKR